MQFKKNTLFILFSVFFLLTRFYNLDKAPIWEDNFSWHYRMNYYPWILETNFKGTNPPEKNLKYAGEISYHPGVTLMSLSGLSSRIGKKVLTAQDPNYVLCGFKDTSCKYFKTEIAIAKIPLILVFSLTFYLMLYLINSKFNFFTSVLFGLYVIFEPFLYTTSRDLHLDYLQTSFMLLAALTLFKSTKKLHLILSGFFLGLSVLTRFPSIFIIPGLLLLSGFSKQGIKNFVIVLLVGVFTFVAFYPPMWRYPLKTVKYIFENSMYSTKSHNSQFDVSEPIAKYFNGFPTYANGVVTFMSPFWYIGALLAAFFILKFEKNPQTKKNLLIFTLVFIGYFLLLNVSDKKFFRYAVPIVVGLTPVISYGIYLGSQFFITKYKNVLK